MLFSVSFSEFCTRPSHFYFEDADFCSSGHPRIACNPLLCHCTLVLPTDEDTPSPAPVAKKVAAPVPQAPIPGAAKPKAAPRGEYAGRGAPRKVFSGDRDANTEGAAAGEGAKEDRGEYPRPLTFLRFFFRKEKGFFFPFRPLGELAGWSAVCRVVGEVIWIGLEVVEKANVVMFITDHTFSRFILSRFASL